MSRDVVVGYDDKEPAKRALDRAIEEARARKSRLVVVAVAEMMLNPEGPQNYGTLDDTPARMIPLVEPPELEPVLSHARQRVAAEGLDDHADYLWLAGEPGSSIVDVAHERKAELIVVGSHHHAFLGRLLGNDVAAEVKRRAECDVIVVE
jgi:nucleotide-binding universal stress UspA family protein